MNVEWTLLANYTCFFVAVETRHGYLDELFERKQKAVEHHFAVERLKIPSQILYSKYIMKDNVSMFLKIYCNGICRCGGCTS